MKKGPPASTRLASAGATHAPNASPSTRRMGGGTAASPKAGTSVTVGIAREKPSAHARGSTPAAVNAPARASSTLGGAENGAMAIDAGAWGALTIPRPKGLAYG